MLTFEHYARHPRLALLADKLAATSGIGANDKLRLIESAATSAGISMLDIEMVQPGAAAIVPFAVSGGVPANAHDERVKHHLHAIIGGRA